MIVSSFDALPVLASSVVHPRRKRLRPPTRLPTPTRNHRHSTAVRNFSVPQRRPSRTGPVKNSSSRARRPLLRPAAPTIFLGRQGGSLRPGPQPKRPRRLVRKLPGAAEGRKAPSGGRTSRVSRRTQRGSTLDPISASSMARAAWRPSRIAQTTSDWPRRTSPAA